MIRTRINVVGSGNVGGALGQRVAAAGHRVFLGYTRGPAKLEPVASEVTPDELEPIRTEAERTRPKKRVRNP